MNDISIHALLAESDLRVLDGSKSSIISIHALLAESDVEKVPADVFYSAFLSTLSLRRATFTLHNILKLFPISIHALLAESDFTLHNILKLFPISIHALLAESDVFSLYGVFYVCIFLSTLSLRRATYLVRGQRPSLGISIHALLAESDVFSLYGVFYVCIFLSTLSLRRATHRSVDCQARLGFLSTLSLRRATLTIMLYDPSSLIFLSTLSLRRATSNGGNHYSYI